MNRLRLLVVFLTLFSSLYSNENTHEIKYCPNTLMQNPLVVVVLMVKDEAHVMRGTLQPYLDAGVDAYLIFDTGSTDDTIAVTKKLFAEYKVKNGVIAQAPWIDFEKSRNQALELTEELFSQATFMLMPDAEWYMHNVEGFLEFCKEHKYEDYPTYDIRILGTNSDWFIPRLARCRSGARFCDDIHEVLMPVTRQRVSRDVYFEYSVSQKGAEKTCARWVRDVEKLLKRYEKDSNSSRTAFYLAQTYACLGDLENSCLWYIRRAAMQGWDEEDFMAQYRLAQTYEALENWEKASHCYLKAFSMRPHRAEPLVRMAQHYWSTDERDLCYIFALRACQLAYPEDDLLFIEKRVYEYVRYDVLGCASWYVEDYETGAWAVKKALEAEPEYEHLKRNLSLYLDKIQCN